ncbi:oligopeptide/dipeptide ABC transporter ATP-binding protein [Rhodoligotrophos appendicifer]|uniref:ABC transporter ATP-binding protein n=1 Tax=Rhodoligotrophos appendicifer TaxID=987056 RepID=UPI00117DF2AE|nr:ABC transporter ATP-binding protein [Rhodoligotrophos appendicifer]
MSGLATETPFPAAVTAPAPRVLDIQDLRTTIRMRSGDIAAVNGVSLHLAASETLGIVGESGCGKSMTALSILRLLPPVARIAGGRVEFQGRDLVQLSPEEMRKVRGKDISMIFQEPMTSLNPMMSIGRQIGEVLTLHEGVSSRDAMDRAVEMLRLVRIPEPERRVHEHPHQMSGGMRQRVMIAIALACNPKILLADEPTTALDVTIQAQIMELMTDLQERLDTAVVLITHDLGLIAENADRVVVMYAGKKVEEAAVSGLFEHPCHPYSLGLLGSIPRLGSSAMGAGRTRLTEIKGSVPALSRMPKGCSFEPRCPFATQHCREQEPPLDEKLPGQWAACWHTDKVLAAGL